VHAANYHAYGYRRTWKALLRAGEQVGRDRVKRLMRVHGIQGAKRRGKPWRTTKPDSAARRRPDLVQRDFTTSRPDRLWVADLSYLRCWEGVVFFAFVIDAYSRRVVGWQLAAHVRTDLVLDALRMALGQRRPGADVAPDQSGEKDRRGPLSKHGPTYLRWALLEATMHALKHPAYAERYQRNKRRLGKQRGAKVAQVDIARRLCHAIWHMLSRGQKFAPKGAARRLAA
jgi:transposase InsO family protein